MRVRDRARGFAATDLFAVLVAAVLLAGLGQASLRRIRLAAESTICKENLRQHHTAVAVHRENSGGDLAYEDWLHVWLRQLRAAHEPFAKAAFCPSAPARSAEEMKRDSTSGGSVSRAWIVNSGKTGSKAIYEGSYGLNGYFYKNDPFTDVTRHFSKDGSIPFPSLSPMFADSCWFDSWPGESDLPPSNLALGDGHGGMARFCMPRHDAPPAAAVKNFDPKDKLPGAINAVFADGHAETVLLENLWKLHWHNQWKTPEKRPGL